MGDEQQIMDSFKAGLSIINRTLAGLTPFKVVDILDDDQRGPHARIDIEGERFYVAPNTSGSKIWIADFPIKNTEGTDIPPGYIGFPSEVAGVISKYYREKPKGPLQKLTGIGTINLNEMVREELKKVFEDYDYAAAEREYADKDYYRQDVEAEVSTALSFMQDVQGSLNKIQTQKDLKSTTPEVDSHLDEAMNHLNEAMNAYLESLLPEAKSIVVDRLGEVNIDK